MESREKGPSEMGEELEQGHLGTGRLVGRWLQHRVGSSRVSGRPLGISDSVGPRLRAETMHFQQTPGGCRCSWPKGLLFEQQE